MNFDTLWREYVQAFSLDCNSSLTSVPSCFSSLYIDDLNIYLKSPNVKKLSGAKLTRQSSSAGVTSGDLLQEMLDMLLVPNMPFTKNMAVHNQGRRDEHIVLFHIKNLFKFMGDFKLASTAQFFQRIQDIFDKASLKGIFLIDNLDLNFRSPPRS